MQIKHIEKSQGGAGTLRVGEERGKEGGTEREKITIERAQCLSDTERCNNDISSGCRVGWLLIKRLFPPNTNFPPLLILLFFSPAGLPPFPLPTPHFLCSLFPPESIYKMLPEEVDCTMVHGCHGNTQLPKPESCQNDLGSDLGWVRG